MATNPDSTAEVDEKPLNFNGPPWEVRAWCKLAHLSRAYVYELWKMGLGPRRRKFGNHTVIVESPIDFALRMGRDPDAPADGGAQ